MKNEKVRTASLLLFFSVLLIIGTGKLGRQLWNATQAFDRSESEWQQAADAPRILKTQAQKLSMLQREIDKQTESNRSGLDLLSEIEAACREYGLRLLSLPQERQPTAGENRLYEIQFSMEGNLRDILLLSHRWEYQERLGRLAYFKLAREQIRHRGKQEIQLVATLRFQRFL
jgi:hypothetical protein